MMKFYIFLLFIIFANAHYWDSLKVIEDNIDDNVNPCDDFYRHMCARNKPEETTWARLLQNAYLSDITEHFNKHVPKTIFKTMHQGHRIMQQNFSLVPLEELPIKYLEICQKNSTAALVFLETLELFFGREPNDQCWGYLCFSNLALDSDCHRASYTLKKGAKARLVESIKFYEKEIGYLERTYSNTLAGIWALHHQDEFKQASEMFTFFKDELLKSIEKTPWLLNSNTMQIFYNIVSRMRLSAKKKQYEENYSNVLNYQLSYENCVRTYKLLGSFASEYCFLFSLPDYEEDEDLGIASAYNQHPEITLLNQYISTMSENGSIALKIGFIGATIGHEMGHSVILSDLHDGFYPYYSSEIIPCVQDQFNKTCSVFKEGSCEVKDIQAEENGADIFGYPFAYDRLKQIMGNQINEKIPESKRGLTHAQVFFYLIYPDACRREDVYEPENDPHAHGAENIRVNAGVIQIPDFAKVFNCSKDSRMMLSKTKQCHVFGENAPQH